MRVADGEEPAWNLHRQIEIDADGEVADVHVAAALVGRHGAEAARFGTGEADRAAEGFKRHARDARISRRRAKARVVGPDVERRLWKILRQQAEARDDRGPCPARRREVDQGRLDGVAGLGAVHIDRPGDRVDPVEVEIGDRLHAGIGRDLAAHRVDLRERNGLPRRNGRRRLASIVPGHMLMAGVNGAHADRPVRSAHQPISLSANSAKPSIYGSGTLASIGCPARFERRVFTGGERLPGARLP